MFRIPYQCGINNKIQKNEIAKQGLDAAQSLFYVQNDLKFKIKTYRTNH
jgi:hypothetical protein